MSARVSTSTDMVKRATRAIVKGTLEPFYRVANTLSKKDLHDESLRRFCFDSGVISAGLEVMAGCQGVASLDPSFSMDTEDDGLRTGRAAMVERVAAAKAATREAAAARAASSKGAYWAKGTGYGFDDGDDYYDDDYSSGTGISVRDSAKVAAQAVIASHTEAFLRLLVALVEPVDDVAVPSCAHDVLAASCLVPVLQALLRESEELAEAHAGLFRQVVRTTRVLARVAPLHPLLFHKAGSATCLADLIQEQAVVAREAAELMASAKESVEDLSEADLGGLAPFQHYIQSTADLVAALEAPPSVDEEAVEEEAAAPAPAAGAGEAAAPATPADTPATDGEGGEEEEDDEKGPLPLPTDVMVLDKEYVAALGKHVFGSRSMEGVAAGAGDSATEYKHHYRSSISGEGATVSKGRATRVMKELRSLRRSLPLNASSSVFLRYDKKRINVIQALITGPTDTPYDSGCFLFDIYCPPSYPSSCPSCNLMTTGGGTVRFNPNLYNCGKVCLSLLGTWGGSSEETWTKDSTLLQLLVSIQSLIFVNQPYFNEPGVERSMNSKSGRKASRTSSNGGWEPLRASSVEFGMLDMLRNPPAGFEDVIREHFRVKAGYISDVLDAWLAEAKASKEKLTTLAGELRTELAKLAPAPPAPAAADTCAVRDVVPMPPPAPLVRATSG